MLYVLDTDVFSEYRRKNATIVTALESLPADSLAITVITVEEQLAGWYDMLRRAKTEESLIATYGQLATTAESFSGITILPLTKGALAHYEHWKTLKLNIGRMDMRIAAIALEFGGSVVTRNRRDFERIPGITLHSLLVNE